MFQQMTEQVYYISCKVEINTTMKEDLYNPRGLGAC